MEQENIDQYTNNHWYQNTGLKQGDSERDDRILSQDAKIRQGITSIREINLKQEKNPKQEMNSSQEPSSNRGVGSNQEADRARGADLVQEADLERETDPARNPGIFGAEKKGFYKKISIGLKNFFSNIGIVLSKIFVKKENVESEAFVSPTNKNMFNTSEVNTGKMDMPEDIKNNLHDSYDPYGSHNLHNSYNHNPHDSHDSKDPHVSHTAYSSHVSHPHTSQDDCYEPHGTLVNPNTLANHDPLASHDSPGTLNSQQGDNQSNYQPGYQSNHKTDNPETNQIKIPEIFYPETEADLVWLLQKLPETVISIKQKKTIGAAMSFDGKKVSDIMTPKDEIIFVRENDYLGPLTLSRLYQSGLSHFPVTDTKGEVVGVLHTKTLFSLSVKETDQASTFLDKKVYYVSESYSLKEALLAFIRTSCYFFIVIDDYGKVTGLLNIKELISTLVGGLPNTDFDQDQERMAVAKYARELLAEKSTSRID